MPPDARFDPQSVLIDWKDARGFTVADAQTGVAVFGATGSGKTSGPGQLLAARRTATCSPISSISRFSQGSRCRCLSCARLRTLRP
jgi:hypothetical protein